MEHSDKAALNYQQIGGWVNNSKKWGKIVFSSK